MPTPIPPHTQARAPEEPEDAFLGRGAFIALVREALAASPRQLVTVLRADVHDVGGDSLAASIAEEPACAGRTCALEDGSFAVLVCSPRVDAVYRLSTRLANAVSLREARLGNLHAQTITAAFVAHDRCLDAIPVLEGADEALAVARRSARRTSTLH